MKKQVIFLFILVIFSLFISGCMTQQATKNLDTFNPENSEKIIVTKIVDGDTIIIQGGETVRLLGIDTPERGDDYYSDAKNFLENRILFKEVYLETDIEDRDVYKRLLRWIWLDNSLINLEQIQNGYAISRLYEGEKYQEQIKTAENLAISQKIGIWSRLSNPENTTTKTIPNTLNTTLNDNSCISLGCPSRTIYVASKNSGKYHSCSCYNAKRINTENLLCFSSKEEVEKSRILASCG
jgi:micrococcal nuclease